MTKYPDPETFEKYPLLGECVSFHGHLCPGLALGYKASFFAIQSLKEKRSEDEEIVAVVENDSCFVDAVQVVTGCTFGKGNLIFRDYGKMALSLLSRRNGIAIRVSLKSPMSPPEERILEILEKIRSGRSSSDEKRVFEDFQRKRALEILSSPFEDMFSLKEINIEPPNYARVMKSEKCEICLEPVMVTRIVNLEGKRVCIPCSMGKKG